MKVKVDENLPASVARMLATHGHDAHTVLDEDLGGAADERIAESVRAEQRMLITLDRGFGDIRAYPPGSHAGIVVLRVPDQRPQFTLAAVETLLNQHLLDDLEGCIVVVQPTAIRIRRPDGQ